MWWSSGSTCESTLTLGVVTLNQIVAMNSEAFARSLLVEVPELVPVVDEHLGEHDELLLHLLVGDIRRACEEAWNARDPQFLSRVLRCLDGALAAGDEYVQNAVAVSFVHDSCWWDPMLEDY